MSKSGSAVVCSKTGFLDIDFRIGRVVANGKTPLKKWPNVLQENLLGVEGIDAFGVEFRSALFRLTKEVVSAVFKNDLCT